MNYFVRFTANDGSTIEGEVVAEEDELLRVYACWQVKADGSKCWNLFWLPKSKCIRI